VREKWEEFVKWCRYQDYLHLKRRYGLSDLVATVNSSALRGFAVWLLSR